MATLTQYPAPWGSRRIRQLVMPPPSEWALVLEPDTRDARRCLNLGRQLVNVGHEVHVSHVPLHHIT